VSLIAPVYNERDNLLDLVTQVAAAMASAGISFELLCVDDGSRDGSDRVLAELAQTRDWLRPLFLNRNYGQSTAMQAGFDAARGAVLITLDADLQNDPADIPRLLEVLEARPEIDILSGWRRDRQDRALSRKLPSRLANRLISAVTGVRLHDYGCSLKLYRREALEHVKIYGELHRFIPALAGQFGARVMEVSVNHRARTRGQSIYCIDRTIRVLLDLLWVKFLLRYRHRPMHAFGGAGALMSVAGFGLLGLVAVFIPAAALVALGIASHNAIVGVPLFAIAAIYALLGATVLSALSGIFRTALYRYAVDGTVPAAFAGAGVEESFVPKPARR
jgi:glycosyltransferase involved in cell wall biosynthesis